MRTIEGNGYTIRDYTDKDLPEPTAADWQRAIDEMDAAVARGEGEWAADAREWVLEAAAA